MNTRTFGVEIECGYGGADSCSCECSCHTCSYCENGCEESLGEDEECSCECYCEECYYCYIGCDGECSIPSECGYASDLLCQHGFSHWTYAIHSDGSGVEIPSPVLQGREGLDELRRVMHLLDQNGFYAGEADGLHVHHGAEEWAEDNGLLAHTIELWEENLPLIHKFVARDRAHSMYCEPHKDGGLYRENRWAEFKRTKNTDHLRDKFKALNIAHLSSLGTLEFRLHQGTLNFDKAASWISFGQNFLEFAKRTYRREEIITCASAIDLLRQVNTSGKTTRTLLTKAAA